MSDNLVQELFTESGAATADAVDQSVLDFTASVAELRTIVERLNLVVSTRDVMPVLKHIKIEAVGRWPASLHDQLTLTSSDMELTLRTRTTQVLITTPGQAVVPARRLLDILKTLRVGTDVRITVLARTMTVHSDSTRWTVNVPTGADFPAWQMAGEGVTATVDTAAFTEAIDRVRYAAAGADRDLAAVNLGAEHITACDGARFAQTAFRLALPRDVVLPIAAVDRVFKLAAGSFADTMTVGDLGRHIALEIGSSVFLVAKSGQPYPDMAATMLRPIMSNRAELVCDRDELRTALRRVAVTVDSDSRGVALHLSRHGVLVVARDDQNNETTHELTGGWCGPARTLTVDLAHLTDLIRRHSDPQLRFFLGADTKTRRNPILLTDYDTNTVGVIPQMHLPWAP